MVGLLHLPPIIKAAMMAASHGATRPTMTPAPSVGTGPKQPFEVAVNDGSGFRPAIDASSASQARPDLPAHSLSDQVQVLKNTGYMVGYSPAKRLPLWVYFKLPSIHPFYRTSRPKDDAFRPDSRVSNPVTSYEFRGTGYQRGHLATSSTIGFYYGPDAQYETFLLTNIVPQIGWHNEGIWNTLERIEADDYPKRYGVTESICGPVLSGRMLGTYLPLPRALYKIIHRPDGHCLAFIIPQDCPEIPPSRLAEELVSVHDVEEATGLRFDWIDERYKYERAPRLW